MRHRPVYEDGLAVGDGDRGRWLGAQRRFYEPVTHTTTYKATFPHHALRFQAKLVLLYVLHESLKSVEWGQLLQEQSGWFQTCSTLGDPLRGQADEPEACVQGYVRATHYDVRAKLQHEWKARGLGAKLVDEVHVMGR
ncbi:hypothetical protein PRNP1_014858 [Phytophthora ramorum]